MWYAPVLNGEEIMHSFIYQLEVQARHEDLRRDVQAAQQADRWLHQAIASWVSIMVSLCRPRALLQTAKGQTQPTIVTGDLA